LKPPAKRDAAAFLVAEHGLSRKKACAAVGLSRAAFYRPAPDSTRDDAVVAVLNKQVGLHPRWGFWKLFNRMQTLGYPWNHKRVWRVYKAMKLNLPRRTKKRLPVRERQPLNAPAAVNAVWSMDFMSDVLYNGRRFRTSNVLDDGVREALGIVVDTSIPSGRVVRTLEQIKAWRGLPKAIRVDNSPEFLSQVFVDWCDENQVEIRYIQPGKPNQNAYVERFNRTYRSEVLDAYLFDNLDQVRQMTAEWLRTYNEERPHDALGDKTPAAYREAIEAGVSTFEVST
jgi:putative transposase